MAIAAQRFKFLDNQTNVPVIDFSSINSSDILNNVTNDLLAITQELMSLVSGNQTEGVLSMLSEIADVTNMIQLETNRLTRDFYSSITGVSNWTSNQIHSATSRMFPNDPVMQNAFNQLGDGCKSKILAGIGNCMNKKRMSMFKGMRSMTTDRSCSAETFVNLINHLTGGLYAPKLTDQCALMRMVAGVAIRGFEIGLPKVFSELSTRIEDQHLLAQTGVMVINATAMDGNMLGVMDVANSSVGGMLTALDPSIPSTIMQNFNVPQEYFERDVAGFHTDFMGAMNNMDSNWNQMMFSGIPVPSLANMDASNGELGNFLQCANLQNSFDLPDGSGIAPLPNMTDLLSTGMSLGTQDVGQSFMNNFSDLSFGEHSYGSSNGQNDSSILSFLH
jgi:hypothetical protein